MAQYPSPIARVTGVLVHNFAAFDLATAGKCSDCQAHVLICDCKPAIIRPQPVRASLQQTPPKPTQAAPPAPPLATSTQTPQIPPHAALSELSKPSEITISVTKPAPFYFGVKQLAKAKLSAAIKHNRRTIPCKNADATRSHKNVILAGALGADGVMATAERLVLGTGSKPRRNASWAIELLFTLAPDHGLNDQTYFESCLDWASERYGSGNILSADVHRDEAAPHMHVLVIALRGGKLQGSVILGCKD